MRIPDEKGGDNTHGEDGGELDTNDEDDDVDFNPFLLDSPSREESSILSSDNEAVNGEMNAQLRKSSATEPGNQSVEASSFRIDVTCEDELQSELRGEVIDGKELGSEFGGEEKMLQSKRDKVSLCSDVKLTWTSDGDSNNMSKEQEMLDQTMDALPDLNISRKPVILAQNSHGNEEDEEDAICRRTRARLSLRDMSMDELEMFLQESDEDDYFQNVDDEEEYRKFLAAVIGNPNKDGARNEEANRRGEIDDDDEDDDADYELEIEAALESDPDESWSKKGQKEKFQGLIHRPETRQKNRQKAHLSKDRPMGSKKPLRPLLPLATNIQVSRSSELRKVTMLTESTQQLNLSAANMDVPNGFAAHQIGQLYCLIHEHVQLLIQVFSICALDPSRQEVAEKVKSMILLMADKHDEILAWKTDPYPDICFQSPFLKSSVSQASHISLNASALPSTRTSSDATVPTKPFDVTVGVGNTHSTWVPAVHEHVVSVLDVDPLRMARNFLAEIEVAVSAYKKRRIKDLDNHSYHEKEPLFKVIGPAVSPGQISGLSSSCIQATQKKTLAGALVESSKMQSIAHVPKDIAQLSQRFSPLFNVDLFPHKPPPAAAVNRVLFTDAEDDLLAMGLMIYNSDWKSIQQRFLPCKQINQIFIRQKNRSAAKAPENSIKAVKRMKSSPLTSEEKAIVDQGLKVFKLDWMSIWRYCLPHRDPLLLPRQWRIAIGTQKSYKSTEAEKEKRRLYEAKRRQRKLASANISATCEPEDHQISGPEGDDNSGNEFEEDAAYVHEAFLADWNPTTATLLSPELPVSSRTAVISKNSQFNSSISHEGSNASMSDLSLLRKESIMIEKEVYDHPNEDNRPSQGNHGITQLLNATLPCSELPTKVLPSTNIAWGTSSSMSSRKLTLDCNEKSLRSHIVTRRRPFRLRKTSGFQVVKLAPDLPPVNLPASVRIIPSSAFGSYPCKHSCELNSLHKKNSNTKIAEPRVATTGMTSSTDVVKDRSTNSNSPRNKISPDCNLAQSISEESGVEADLQMHPLLFQVPDEGLWSYRSNKTAISSTSWNIFQENALVVNNLFKDQEAVGAVNTNCLTRKENVSSSAVNIEFHPLLQRPNTVDESILAQHPILNSAQNSDTACVPFPSDNCTKKSKMNSDSAGVSSGGSCERNNELNLDFHLHLGNTEGRISNQRHVDGHANIETFISTRDDTNIKDSLTCNLEAPFSGLHVKHHSPWHSISSIDNAELRPMSSHIGKTVSGCEAIDTPRSLDLRLDNVPLPHIVMEQEELSDSEDDLGENVDFEHEEMADSEEEEESNHGQLDGLNSREALDIQFEVEEIFSDEDPSTKTHASALDHTFGHSDSITSDGYIDEPEKRQKRSRKSRTAVCPRVPTSELAASSIGENVNMKLTGHGAHRGSRTYRSKLKKKRLIVESCRSSR